MNLKEFLKEEREEKKERKKLQKQQKKAPLTKDQKKYKIFGIILGFAIAFGAIFYSCSGLTGGNYTWNSIVGITDEMIIELEKDVDTSKILPNGIIGTKELDSCHEVLLSVGIDLKENSNQNHLPTNNFTLSGRQLGALAKEILAQANINLSMDIIDLEFYMIGEVAYERSVVFINLSSLIINSTLPSVYLTTTSRVEVLDNSIVALNSQVQINNLDSEMNSQVLEVLNKNSNTKFNEIGNSLINTSLDLFIELIGCNSIIGHDQIQFRV